VTFVRLVFTLRSRPGGMPDGSGVTAEHLVVLADDTGHRAVPLWLRILDSKVLWHLLDREAGDDVMAGVLEETAARLLHSAGVAVTAVDIEPNSEDVAELRWDTVTARVGLTSAAGTRDVLVSAGYGMKLAAATGAPVRVADEVMHRLAVPVQGEDVRAPFLPPAAGQPPTGPARHRRFGPRNMGFTDGLDWWQLGGSFSEAGQPHWQDYSTTAGDRSAVLASAVAEPAGFAVLVQTIYADDYRGAAVTFRGQVRTAGVAVDAGLHLTAGRPGDPADAHLRDRAGSSLTGPGSSDWTRVPSAEDLDRADVLSRAVAGLPAGQRQAVTLFYYADQPAGQIATTPGAAKASLHKARRRLREYITAHRPDLVPAVSRRTPMTPVRIAHADPWPGRRPDGRMAVRGVLVVLAGVVPTEDGGHRALPVRLTGRDGAFWRLLARPEDRDEQRPHDDVEEMTGELLSAAGITVTAVTVSDLGPGVTAARIDIAGPGGTRQITARLAHGLALAVITGAPLAVEDQVMDRLAEPVTGPDLLGPFRGRQQEDPGPPARPRFEPRNLAFSDGLRRWRLDGSFRRQGTGSDYSCTAEDGRAILTAAVPEPAGFAFLGQAINADDYRGRAVTFRGELRSTDVADTGDPAGLVLRVIGEGPFPPQRSARPDPRHDPANRFAFITGSRDWTRHEVTAQVPPDAGRIIFGLFLNGGGRIELRNTQLEAHPTLP